MRLPERSECPSVSGSLGTEQIRHLAPTLSAISTREGSRISNTSELPPRVVWTFARILRYGKMPLRALRRTGSVFPEGAAAFAV